MKTIPDALDRVDWAFPSAGNEAGSLHITHWFPGNFIPQIPAHLIQILSAPGDVVLDPFSGSNTSGVEAVKLGRHAICSDLLQASILIGQGKLAGLRSSVTRSENQRILNCLDWTHLCESEATGRFGEGSDPALAEWYAPRTLSQLKYLWSIVETCAGHLRNILELLFSNTLFACASTGRSQTTGGKVRRHHWGWVADNVRPIKPIEHDAIAMFRSRWISFPEASSDAPGMDVAALMLRQDARKLGIETASIDLIVTSPPYIGVIDYTRANRLLYMWKGWHLDNDKAQEIGARYKRGRNAILLQYLHDMDACWAEMARVLRTGRYCAIVLGESRKFPGTAKHALGALEKYMNLIWGPIPRISSRRRVSDRGATEGVELVAVFRNK